MKRLMIVLAVLVFAVPAWAGGPIILMGIDAEDGGPNAHGAIDNYVGVVNSLLSNVTNGGSGGILVIGGGKAPADAVTRFWNAIGAPVPLLGTGQPVTYVSGNTSITNVSFSGFAMIAVVSDIFNTPSGGLTVAEGTSLNARSSDIASFVNGGGGLLGFSQCDLLNPYGYLGVVGGVTCSGVDYDNITQTAAGGTVGITDALDICCWHDTYTTFPSFLNILATATSLGGSLLPPGLVAAIGGAEVVIPGFVLTPPTATNPINSSHTVVITVTQTVGGGSPTGVNDVTVTFTVTGANNPPSGFCVTSGAGQCSFAYTGTNIGTDTITAIATVAGIPQTASVSKIWAVATTTVAGTGERIGPPPEPPGVPPGFNGDGILAINSQLSSPFAVAVDGAGNAFIADRNNHRIRRVDAGSGNISTFVGTGVPGFNGDVDGAGTPRPANQAQLNSPTGVAIDDEGKIIIVDSGNHIIRVVNPNVNPPTITTVAGTPMTPGFRDGNQGDLVSNPAAAPRFLFPRSVAFHALDQSLIVADANNQRIRRVNTSTGDVSTLKGDGVPDFADDSAPTGARLNNPMGVAVDGVNVFVADEGNQRIRVFSVLGNVIGDIATVAGSGVKGSAEGAALSAEFDSPSGVAVDSGSVYVADLGNNKIRKVQAGVMSTFAGTGVPGLADGLAAQFDGPISVALGSGELLVVDLGNQRVRRIIFESGSD